MDINIAIDHLGLNANSYKLTQSVPPHSIVEWNGPDAQPTEAELQAAYDAAIVNVAWKALRAERDRRLAETDWVTLKALDASIDGLGIQLPQVWMDYRQALRDLPANTVDPANPVWPVKPGGNP
jgi:hypothetical protein